MPPTVPHRSPHLRQGSTLAAALNRPTPSVAVSSFKMHKDDAAPLVKPPGTLPAVVAFSGTSRTLHQYYTNARCGDVRSGSLLEALPDFASGTPPLMGPRHLTGSYSALLLLTSHSPRTTKVVPKMLLQILNFDTEKMRYCSAA